MSIVVILEIWVNVRKSVQIEGEAAGICAFVRCSNLLMRMLRYGRRTNTVPLQSGSACENTDRLTIRG